MHMERHLAAILASDVVGYSQLMGIDERGTLQRLKVCEAQVIEPIVATHNGRIVKRMGDGFLVEFTSVVDAVECAIAWQGATSDPDEDLRFRMGINLGDVIAEQGDIYGDGVNIAARLEALAEPGSICVSSNVHEQVRGKVAASFDDLGDVEFKNIAGPVRAYRVIPLPDGYEQAKQANAKEPSRDKGEKPTIAVLPFDNVSGDLEQEYFADGLTEDIITALTRWRSFPVIARNSCFAYKNKAVNIKQVGRELGARYLLEGSVRKHGTRVRITSQLIDGANGHHVWAEKYDRELDDIFEVQDEIVQRIAALVAPELAKAELKRSTDKLSEDLDVWDLYLRALPLVRQRTRESNVEARELFLRAISLRPDYADAYSGLAMSYNADIIIDATEDRTATATLAMEAAQQAVKFDEASSWSHHELSTAYQLLDRHEDALAEARIAVDLNPNDAYALHALGNKSDLAGDKNGIAFMEKAQKLNPQDVRLHTLLVYVARAYVNIGNYRVAAERARQAIRRRSDYAPAHYILAIALAHLGDLEEARAVLAKCDETSPGFVQSRLNWRPYADPASNDRLQEGLRRIEG